MKSEAKMFQKIMPMLLRNIFYHRKNKSKIILAKSIAILILKNSNYI
jgi:hypothetical protein